MQRSCRKIISVGLNSESVPSRHGITETPDPLFHASGSAGKRIQSTEKPARMPIPTACRISEPVGTTYAGYRIGHFGAASALDPAMAIALAQISALWFSGPSSRPKRHFAGAALVWNDKTIGSLTGSRQTKKTPTHP